MQAWWIQNRSTSKLKQTQTVWMCHMVVHYRHWCHNVGSDSDRSQWRCGMNFTYEHVCRTEWPNGRYIEMYEWKVGWSSAELQGWNKWNCEKYCTVGFSCCYCSKRDHSKLTSVDIHSYIQLTRNLCWNSRKKSFSSFLIGEAERVHGNSHHNTILLYYNSLDSCRNLHSFIWSIALFAAKKNWKYMRHRALLHACTQYWMMDGSLAGKLPWMSSWHLNSPESMQNSK